MKTGTGTNDPIMIGFFHENEKYGCFSNWYHAEFDYAGRHYANSEQFMMYHKVLMFRKYDLADQIMRILSPLLDHECPGMDIANMVLFLCSDKAGFITGENTCIDGGMTRLMIYHDDHGWTYEP